MYDLTIGGHTIGTTSEHPFFVRGKGWTPAKALQPGDEVRLLTPGWQRIDANVDTGRTETVYNLEVEGDHTYFVGDLTWGWQAWAHNATVVCQTGTTNSGTSRLSRLWRQLYGPGVNRRHHILPQELMTTPGFVQSMQNLGFRTTREIRRFLNKHIADIPNTTHMRMHAAGYNKMWKDWVVNNPKFTFAQLRQQMRLMRKLFDIPKSSLRGRVYGR